MSRASRKGYIGESMVAAWFTARGYYVWRPRTTSRHHTDTGDLHGVPFVVSVKHCARTCLAEWVDELADLVARSTWTTGLLVHKRTKRGQADDWYVTLPLRLMGPFVDAYVACHASSVEPAEELDSPGHRQAHRDGEEQNGGRVTERIPADVKPPRTPTPHRYPRNP